jgi:hypothetical protein
MAGRSLIPELANFLEAAWLDVPAEAGKVLLGASDENALRAAGWRAYDAWVRLVNEFTNALYSDPLTGQVAGQLAESALRLRRLGGAMVTAFWGNLWPLIGLPTQAQMAAVRHDLLALREELTIHATASGNATASAAPDPVRAIAKGPHLSGSRATNGRGDAVRSSNQGKHYGAP